MGSFTFSEVLTILIVILIVFGPTRLPELARRAGELVARTRNATRSMTSALEREYGDEAQSFRDLKGQLDGVRDDVRNAADTFTEIAAAPADSEAAELPSEGDTDEPSGEPPTDPGDATSA